MSQSTPASRPRISKRPDPAPGAYAFTIVDAQRMGGPGRTKMYELCNEGKLKMIRLGGRTLIDGDSLRALLAGA